MKIKMLESMAGVDFSLSAGDVTDRFTKKEADRMISTGLAVLAPPDPVKKPETKKEWDEERAQLLAENERLVTEASAAAALVGELQAQIADLVAFKAAVAGALGPVAPVVETTDAVDLSEKRG